MRVTRPVKIRNEHIRGSEGLAGIARKMRVNRLRWFEHLERRNMTKQSTI